MEPRVIATGVGFCEGPVWTADGRLVVTSIDHSCLYLIEGGKATILARTGGGPNGLTEGADGTLYVTQNGGVYGAGERVAATLEAGIQAVSDGRVSYLARGLDAPNDLCFGPDDRLYFTDPRGPATPQNTLPGRVYVMRLGSPAELLLEGPAFTNGIAFGPEPEFLYVAETFRGRVLRYRLQDGRAAEPEVFCTTEPGFPDGLCFDVNGQLFVAATLARQVQVFNPSGRRVARLPCGERSLPTNCCFGGKQGTALYVTDSLGQRVLAFEMGVRGLPLYPRRAP